jgi:predicted transcriptional regulator
VFAFVLASIVMVSFAALMYQQKSFAFTLSPAAPNLFQMQSGSQSLGVANSHPYCMLAFPTIAFNADVNVNSQAAFSNSTRTQIYNYVEGNPGVQFRGLCSALSLPVGLAQYHLGVLIKAGLVSFIRDGRYKRFFLSKKFSRKEMLTISLLRHKTVKRIVEALLHKKQMSHGELAGEVSITSQALTWQMKRLGKTEFITQTDDGLRTLYSLDENSVPLLTEYLTLVEEDR